jgi:hypothetical protein
MDACDAVPAIGGQPEVVQIPPPEPGPGRTGLFTGLGTDEGRGSPAPPLRV